MYDSHLDQWLYSITGKRREGGPLMWSSQAFGFADDAIEFVLKSRHLRVHSGNFLLLVPVQVTSKRIKTGPITSEEFYRDAVPDWRNAVEIVL